LGKSYTIFEETSQCVWKLFPLAVLGELEMRKKARALVGSRALTLLN